MSLSANLLEVTVVRKASEAEDICSFELARTDGQPLPPFSAGAHIDVHVGDGLVRQYSLCNPPHERQRYVIGVLRDAASRGGSRVLHDTVHEGGRLRISAPKNLFPLAEARRSVLLAGGIGVTPLLAMAESLAARGADFTLHYCSRSLERTAFRERLAQAAYADRVQFHYDSGPAEQRLDLAALLAAPDAQTHIYVCGPGGFISYVTETAKALGWPERQVHYEYFAAPAAPAAEEGGDQPFQVKLARSGATVTVPAGRSVTAVLAEHGVQIPVACEQGVCGTCVTRVLQGEPDHRDVYLTDEERAGEGLFTPCCSRAKGAQLVLDL
jgi:vanillate O-demethylase ferredoxin subunit